MSPRVRVATLERVTPSNTLLLRASSVNSGTTAHRHLGVDSTLTLQDLAGVLATAFGTNASAPWLFGYEGTPLPTDLRIGTVLGSAGDGIDADWGLWQFTIDTLDVWTRDSGTPLALCIGGAGSFANSDFDIRHINRELLGPEATEAILATTRPEVAHLIRRAGIHDFVPLLQALDLTGDSRVPKEIRMGVGKLPIEEEHIERDAFWVCALALASLAEEGAANTIIEATMSALGWRNDDGSELAAPQIRELCADSLLALADLGAYGHPARSAVERLDIYRELLG